MKQKQQSDNYYENLFLLFASIAFIDRMSKIFLQDGCFSIFCISKTFNTGAAFGILPGMTELFIAVASVVLVVIFFTVPKVNKPIQIAMVLIAGGTLANLLDRIFFGYVIDIFRIAGSSTFNLADLSNCIGGIILIYQLVKSEKL